MANWMTDMAKSTMMQRRRLRRNRRSLPPSSGGQLGLPTIVLRHPLSEMRRAGHLHGASLLAF